MILYLDNCALNWIKTLTIMFTLSQYPIILSKVGWSCVTKSNTYRPKTNSTIRMQPNIFFKDISCLCIWEHGNKANNFRDRKYFWEQCHLYQGNR